MKDVLEYSDDELKSMSDEDLKVLLKQAENLESLFNVSQLVQKTLINSLYGALGNTYFPLFNEDMAAAITGNGRYFIQKAANTVEAGLQKILPSDDPYIIYGDTDSFYMAIAPIMEKYQEKNPNLSINEYVEWADQFEKKYIQPLVQKAIEDFAHELNAYNKDAIGCEREIIADCLAPNTTLKVKTGDDVKKMTISKLGEIHGLCSRGKFEDIVDLSDKDVRILSYNPNTGEKELKRVLNVQKKVTKKRMLTLTAPNNKSITVTEDHRFAVHTNNGIIFKQAKDITVYDDVEFFNSAGMKDIIVSEAKYVDERKIVYDIEVEDNHNFYANNFLVHNCGVFAAKKKYYLRVRDDEGTRFPEDSPYFKKMGLEVIKSSTPIWSKKYLQEAIPHILDKNNDELLEWLKTIKNEFVQVDPNEIAAVGAASRLDYDLDAGSVPFGSRAAIVYNNYIKENGLDSKFEPIQAGEKFKRLYLTTPNKFNSDVIGFKNEDFVNEIDCIDYDTQFEKLFLKPLELMVESLKYNLKKETQSLDDW